eukprot:766527-Hanusia_phi.AAC.4
MSLLNLCHYPPPTPPPPPPPPPAFPPLPPPPPLPCKSDAVSRGDAVPHLHAVHPGRQRGRRAAGQEDERDEQVMGGLIQGTARRQAFEPRREPALSRFRMLLVVRRDEVRGDVLADVQRGSLVLPTIPQILKQRSKKKKARYRWQLGGFTWI